MDRKGPDRKFKILFLCTGNSARSILAEFFLRRLDPRRFEVFSAGANPKGRVNPHVLELLRDSYHIDPSSARSKSWEEFRDVKFDFVITVCDKARESCPLWPGQPVIAHWGSVDPDASVGEEAQRQAIKKVGLEIYRRLGLFTSLPLESLDRLRLEQMTRAIGTESSANDAGPVCRVERLRMPVQSIVRLSGSKTWTGWIQRFRGKSSAAPPPHVTGRCRASAGR